MRLVANIDQSDRDAHLIRLASNAAFEQVPHA
jgi:hypothetical protein